MSNCTLVTGAILGDEGKGRVIDELSQEADVVVRWGGGPNAGHTVVVNGKTYKVSALPCGFLHPEKRLVISQGALINPTVLLDEAAKFNVFDRLFVSDKAHLILPYHIFWDEQLDKINKIGTTKRGIGPTVRDKVLRTGLRLGDFRHNNKKAQERLDLMFEQYAEFCKVHNLPVALPAEFGATKANILLNVQTIFERFNVVDTATLLNDELDNNRNLLLEGAQGALLDIDHGTYPYVTSTNCVTGAASVGTGIPMKRFTKTIGVFKAYTTRVGEGPFPTELTGEIAEQLRAKGNEYGAVTKRPRRVGWLDLPALNYSCMINGFDELVMTKFDVLEGMEIKYATKYKLENCSTNCADAFAMEYASRNSADISYNTIKTNSVLEYVEEIGQYIRAPIKMVSTSPERGKGFERID